jgi:hypothetical protein
MPRCAASKPDGNPCERIVGASQRYCYAHDPARSDDRKRNASKGGKGKGSRNLSDLDKQLDKLAADVLSGHVDRRVGAVVNQIINSRLRSIEIERKVIEVEEVKERMQALEDVLKRRRTG